MEGGFSPLAAAMVNAESGLKSKRKCVLATGGEGKVEGPPCRGPAAPEPLPCAGKPPLPASSPVRVSRPGLLVHTRNVAGRMSAWQWELLGVPCTALILPRLY